MNYRRLAERLYCSRGTNKSSADEINHIEKTLTEAFQEEIDKRDARIKKLEMALGSYELPRVVEIMDHFASGKKNPWGMLEPIAVLAEVYQGIANYNFRAQAVLKEKEG